MKKKLLLLFLCLCGGFLVNAQNISSVLPAQNPAPEGIPLTVNISGNNTNFGQGTATFVYAYVGPSYVPGSVLNVSSNTNMDAMLYLPCGVCGNATLYVNTSLDGTMTYPSAFSINCAQLLSSTPDTISAGQTLPIDISGTGLNFLQGSSASAFFQNTSTGQVLHPSSYNSISTDSINANLSIPSNFPCSGFYNVCASYGSGCITCLPNALYINGTNIPPQINSVSPGSTSGGQLLTVSISGTNTNFLQGSNLFFQLYNNSFGSTNAFTYNPSSSTQTTASFFMPNICGSYDLFIYGADPCSPNPVIYNNAVTVTSTLNPQISAISPNSGATQQTLTLNLTGLEIDFTQSSPNLSFRLVHAGTGATLTGTNLIPNGSNSSMATVDFNPSASDCGLYHLMIDSVSTGCSDVTTVVYSNAVTINSPTNPQLQTITPDTAVFGHQSGVFLVD